MSKTAETSYEDDLHADAAELVIKLRRGLAGVKEVNAFCRRAGVARRIWRDAYRRYSLVEVVRAEKS